MFARDSFARCSCVSALTRRCGGFARFRTPAAEREMVSFALRELLPRVAEE